MTIQDLPALLAALRARLPAWRWHESMPSPDHLSARGWYGNQEVSVLLPHPGQAFEGVTIHPPDATTHHAPADATPEDLAAATEAALRASLASARRLLDREARMIADLTASLPQEEPSP